MCTFHDVHEISIYKADNGHDPALFLEREIRLWLAHDNFSKVDMTARGNGREAIPTCSSLHQLVFQSDKRYYKSRIDSSIQEKENTQISVFEDCYVSYKFWAFHNLNHRDMLLHHHSLTSVSEDIKKFKIILSCV